MRNIYGTYIIYVIAFAFIMIFVGYLCISINQTKAFNAKNEVVKAIERDYPFMQDKGAVTREFNNDIKDAFARLGYRSVGSCNANEEGFCKDPSGNIIKTCEPDKNLFCIAVINDERSNLCGHIYTVRTFYQLDLSIINRVFDLTASGQTKWLYSSTTNSGC